MRVVSPVVKVLEARADRSSRFLAVAAPKAPALSAEEVEAAVRASSFSASTGLSMLASRALLAAIKGAL